MVVKLNFKKNSSTQKHRTELFLQRESEYLTRAIDALKTSLDRIYNFYDLVVYDRLLD